MFTEAVNRATPARPSVAIIGAGISGLTSAKALQDYAVPYTVFEAGDHIGGNWAFKNSNGRSERSSRTAPI